MDACLQREVTTAVEDMLRHRGWAWQPRDAEWREAFAFLWPAACACPAPHTALFYCAGPTVSTVLLITDQAKIGMSQLRQGYEALARVGAKRLQLVARHGITTQTMNLNQTLPSDRHISILLWSLVLLHPLDHELVPAHRRATPEERARLTPVNLLPALRSDDAVAQYLALRPGDVVRIERADATVYWRLII